MSVKHNQAPLSYPQERFWLLDKLHPGNTAYNRGRAFRIHGELDRVALHRSFDILFERHEALRTTFPAPNGVPHQFVREFNQSAIEFVDLQADPDAVSDLIDVKVNKRYDLERGPLTRVCLIQTAVNEYFLLIAQHHIISDGTSSSLLLDELSVCYEALRKGMEPELPELNLSYVDYSVQQRKSIDDLKLREKLEYWESVLHDAPVLDLPSDRPRPKAQSLSGAVHTAEISADKLKRLTILGAENVASLFMVMCTVFGILLYKLSGQDDFVVGTPITGRNNTDTQKMQGLFLNTLAMRIRIPKNATFKSLLQCVKEVALDAYNASDIPLEQIIESIQPSRDQSRPPFFQVVINLIPKNTHTLQLHELNVEICTYYKKEAKFDIELYLRSYKNGMKLLWTYNTDLFDRARIEEISKQFNHLLDQVLTDPDVTIDELSLVTPAACDVLPDPRADLKNSRYSLVFDEIRAWAKLTPESVAVEDDVSVWPYQELLERSEHMTQLLLDDGLRKGDVVAITGQPSNQLIAIMIGILRAGCVLLPINHDYPCARKSHMLSVSGAKKLVNCDEFDLKVTNANMQPPVVLAEDPAYIFFTSGTTGEPKAIVGTHNALGHFLTWQKNEFQISPNDRFAQISKLSFDVLMRDVFIPLVSGATLVMSQSDAYRLDFFNWVRTKKITRFHVVPSVLKFWISETGKKNLLENHLQTIFSAGEALTSSLVKSLRAMIGSHVEIANLYGPTETTLVKSFYRVPQIVSPGVQSIGKPLPESQILVMNKSDHLCGFYEPGEIVIRTPHRTLGYLNASNESFFNNPFTGNEDDVLYRTGDIGWYVQDGTLSFWGRKDSQVKIRGVRIEPEMITNVLASCPGVQNCAVLPIYDDDQNLLLTAYVVTEACSSLEYIRQFLQERLPSSNVPDSIKKVSTIPLTSNGKIDQRTLEQTNFSSQPTVQDQGELSEMETALLAVWEDALNKKISNVNLRFFDLGGHSLSAVRILIRIRDQFNIDFPLTAILDNPSIREMAKKLS